MVEKSISTEVYDILTHLELRDSDDMFAFEGTTDDVTVPDSHPDFDAVCKERDDLKSRCRALAAELANVKSLLAKTSYSEVKGGVVRGRSKSSASSEDDLDSGKDMTVKHLEEQLGFLVEEMTSMVRQSKEKDQEMAKLRETIEKRDEKIRQLKWEKRSVQEEMGDLREMSNQVTFERDRLQEEREEVMLALQNCVELGGEMEDMLSNVNDLMKVLWDNFAKLETIDVQLLASKKHCSHIENIVQLMSGEEREKISSAFGCQLARRNKVLEECLEDKMRKIKEIEEMLMKLKEAKKVDYH